MKNLSLTLFHILSEDSTPWFSCTMNCEKSAINLAHCAASHGYVSSVLYIYIYIYRVAQKERMFFK